MVSSHTRTRSSHMVTIQGLGHPIQVSSHKCQEPCECWEFHNSRVPSVAGSTDHGVTAIHSRIRLIQGGTFQPLAGTELTSVDECFIHAILCIWDPGVWNPEPHPSAHGQPAGNHQKPRRKRLQGSKTVSRPRICGLQRRSHWYSGFRIDGTIPKIWIPILKTSSGLCHLL